MSIIVKKKRKKKKRSSGIASREVNNVRALFARSVELPRIGRMEEQNVRGERKKKEKEKSVGERSGSNVRGIVFPQLSLGKGKGKLAVDRIDRRILRETRARDRLFLP